MAGDALPAAGAITWSCAGGHCGDYGVALYYSHDGEPAEARIFHEDDAAHVITIEQPTTEAAIDAACEWLREHAEATR
jgi:hypothetical protein